MNVFGDYDAAQAKERCEPGPETPQDLSNSADEGWDGEKYAIDSD